MFHETVNGEESLFTNGSAGPTSSSYLFDPLRDFATLDEFFDSQLFDQYDDLSSEATGLSPINSESVAVSAMDESHLGFHSHDSKSKGLFSEVGIKELLEAVSTTSCVEGPVSSVTKRGTSYAYEPGLRMVHKKVEPVKPTKRKAKPRPKDRRQILDRMAELRRLIPNGDKMSIDRLLDRTIKHMLFLQTVTKQTGGTKQGDQHNGVTWACELRNETMICPLIVEDLSTPGQMLIEILYEEQGLFVEIVDIIRGFGLIILKGVMEVHVDKIWARFVVESEVKKNVTRQEVFSGLVHLLQVKMW